MPSVNALWCNLLSGLCFLLADQARRQLAYEDFVLRPLLGQQYIHRAVRVALPEGFTAALSKQLDRHGGLSSTAWLIPDHTIFPPNAAGGACAHSQRALSGILSGLTQASGSSHHCVKQTNESNA